mmetsp:Transcript_17054/g.33362  ORF Transcript_17054/g.33362 Transcript_17054/m.33362 type:complete len:254 (+) Transcript_17054:350-1111(+)
MRLPLELLKNGILNTCLFLRRKFFASFFVVILSNLSQDSTSLLSTHHGNLGIRPHEDHTRAIGTATHAIVTSTVGVADDAGNLGHVCTRDCSDKFSAILGDTFSLIFATNHESGDILQEDNGGAALAAKFHKVCSLEGRLRKENTIVGDNTNILALNFGKATNKGGAVVGFKFGKARAVNHAGNHLANVKTLTRISRKDSVHLVDIKERFLGSNGRLVDTALKVEIANNIASDLNSVVVILGEMVCDTRLAGV